jgi:hypothetical protein
MVLPTPEAIAELFAIHRGPEAASERIQRAYGLEESKQWHDSRGYTLSDRVWRAKQDVRRQIDLLLRRAVAAGDDALLVARKLEQYLAPRFSPLRDLVGKLVRGQRPSMVTRSPGRGGMGSFSARRLARTEITRAHGLGTVFASDRNPFSDGIKWNLSPGHSESDECDRAASRDVGMGPGVYPKGDAPTYPLHPHELCTLSSQSVKDADQVVRELRVMYDLDAA